ISPTCRTRRTFGSALIDSMNAGVSPNSAVSVGVVPYGESPKTAIVSSSFELGSIGVPLPANAEDDSTVRALKTLRRRFVRIDAWLLGRRDGSGTSKGDSETVRCQFRDPPSTEGRDERRCALSSWNGVREPSRGAPDSPR